MTARSVLDKAQALTTRARTNAAGEKERHERQQIAGMLQQVEAVAEVLASRVAAAREAAGLGVPIRDLNAELASGLPALESRARHGLPSQQALRSARDRLRAHRATVEAALEAVWRPWAQAALRDLQLARVALLPVDPRNDLVVRRLRDVAVKPVPSRPEIRQFHADIEELREPLERLDTHDELLRLLERLTGRVTLADLSDEELRLLRSERGVAAQILLKRA